MVRRHLTEQRRSTLKGLPRGIWALGVVSLFMDISSDMIHGLLPLFLTSVLGASAEMVGLIEGIGEATASMCKLFSGWLSDRLGKRKVLAVLGYSLAAVSKPLFALAPSAELVLAARFSDRIGKGVRELRRSHRAIRLRRSFGRFGGEWHWLCPSWTNSDAECPRQRG